MIKCEVCNSEKDVDVYFGLEETQFLCEDCIYVKEIEIGPK